MESDNSNKDFRERTLRSLKQGLGRLWKRRSVTITEYDPSYKVVYLGNVLTGWAKGKVLLHTIRFVLKPFVNIANFGIY